MTEKKRQITRRDFFRKTGRTAAGAGAAIALPTIITSGALGNAHAAPANDRILIGAIGCGGRGNGNLGNFLRHRDTKVIAVCDVDSRHSGRTRERVEKVNAEKCAEYTDFRKLLENKDIDAVLISTPDHWHALPTILACDAGKDVYCEKPLTLFIAEGQAMVKAARKGRRVVQTGSQQRSSREFRHACELVRNGYLGKIKEVRVGIAGVNYKDPDNPDQPKPSELDYEMWLGPAPFRPYNPKHVHYYFRFFWDFSGGQMTNWGAHHLDIAQWGLGMDNSGPVEITGVGKYDEKKRYEVPKWCEIHYTYANGIKMVCGQGEKMGTTFIGEKGTIYVNRGKLESTPEDIVKQTIKDSDEKLYYSTNHYGNWIECVKERRMPICDVAIGHRSATVCHLGNIAVRSGKKVLWDPEKEEMKDPSMAEWVKKDYRDPWELPYV